MDTKLLSKLQKTTADLKVILKKNVKKNEYHHYAIKVSYFLKI